MEVMRHNQEDENRVNTTLISLARKHEVKIVATNNTFYREKEMLMHTIFCCVCARRKQTTPIGRGRGYRYGLPNQEYYFKTGEEMKTFTDLPEAIWNLAEIVDKIEIYNFMEVYYPNLIFQRSFRCRRYC
jgi:DNA polymerase-3 subunit alpha